MKWFETLKFDPYLRSKIKGGNKQQGLDDEEYVAVELDGGEEQVMDLWNKSNVDIPNRSGRRYRYEFESRGDKESTSKYPITRWFGIIHWQKIPKDHPLYEESDNGKRARLIALSGFGDGENGKFSYLGGTRVSEDYQGEGFGGKVKRERDSYNSKKIGIAGYKQMGWQAFVSGGKVEIKQPKTHSDIPKEVLDHFRESYGKRWTIFDPNWKEELNKSWMDILKVGADFDTSIEGLGEFSVMAPWERQLEHLMGLDEELTEEQIKEKYDKFMDMDLEKIKVNHHKIYEIVKDKLGREPTDDELSEWIKRIFMHEGMHGGHYLTDEDYHERPNWQKEYIAFMGQFPESPYLAFKTLLLHPESLEPQSPLEEALSGLMGHYIGGADLHLDAKKIYKLVRWLDRWGDNHKEKDKLIRAELSQRKNMDKRSMWVDPLPRNWKEVKERYNLTPQHKDYKLFKKMFSGERWKKQVLASQGGKTIAEKMKEAKAEKKLREEREHDRRVAEHESKTGKEGHYRTLSGEKGTKGKWGRKKYASGKW